jgi:hypothetical protein
MRTHAFGYAQRVSGAMRRWRQLQRGGSARRAQLPLAPMGSPGVLVSALQILSASPATTRSR